MILQCRISGIGQSSSTAVDTNSNTADQIATSNSDTCPEQRKTGVVSLSVVDNSFVNIANLRGENDGHDDTVDGNDFAEDDRNQVLGSDSRSLDSGTEDG